MTQTLSQTHTIQWRVLLDENEWNTDAPVEMPAAESPETQGPGRAAGVGWYSAGLLLALALVLGFASGSRPRLGWPQWSGV